LTIRASCGERTIIPRDWRFILLDRLRRLCRLKAAAARTLPVPVILKRFLALDLVFSLGISLFLHLCGVKKHPLTLERHPFRGSSGQACPFSHTAWPSNRDSARFIAVLAQDGKA